MILAVTPDPALAVTIAPRRLEVGRTVRIPASTARAAGKGVDVARVLHARGMPVLAIAAIGGAAGAEFARELEHAGVPHDLVRTQRATRRTYAIVDDADTTNLDEAGAPSRPSEVSAVEARVERHLHAASVLVVSGPSPPGTPPEDRVRMLDAAARCDVVTIVDAGGAALIEAVDHGADLVQPSRDELAAVTGLRSPLDGARWLAARGRSTVLASLGPDGMLLVTPEQRVWRSRLPSAMRGGTTGAGDAAVAAVAAVAARAHADGARSRWQRGDDALATMLRLATAWSAAAMLHPLAGSIADPTQLVVGVAVHEVGDGGDAARRHG